jgi:hypothetical protein
VWAARRRFAQWVKQAARMAQARSGGQAVGHGWGVRSHSLM